MRGLIRDQANKFTGGLVGTSVAVPGLAAITVTILYIYRDERRDSFWISGTNAYVLGTLATIAAWALLAFLFRNRLTSAETANTAVYDELREHFDRLDSRVASLRAQGDPSGGVTASMALAEATAQIETCRRELGLVEGRRAPGGMEWVVATGYVALWRRLHRVGEALFLVEPKTDVVGTGLYDEARLAASTIPGRDQLLHQVRTAICVLDPSAEVYLADKTDADTEEPRSELDACDEQQARVVLRNAARVINEFRDDRREGLVRARNNLYRTVFVTGLGAYLLLGLALVREVDEAAVVAMSAFYLVGGILGLFRQLGQASSIDTVKEGDYGLSTARLLHTPLFSGLAAVGGVVLVAVVGAVIPSEGSPDIPGLEDIFDLGKNQFGLVAAAAFGLTPNLLIQRLEKQAEQFKDDLKSTEASGVSTASATQT